MKNKCIRLIFTVILLAFAACKKEQSRSIIGKWQQNKVRVYQINNAGVVLNDTTYSGQTFTDMDFVQFNTNSTCTISSSHDYYPSGQGFPNPPPADQITSDWIFTAAGTKYVITNTGNTVNPGGFNPTDTASVLSLNTVLLHHVNRLYIFNPTTTVLDAYYTKASN